MQFTASVAAHGQQGHFSVIDLIGPELDEQVVDQPGASVNQFDDRLASQKARLQVFTSLR
jgi:hypothetical protein